MASPEPNARRASGTRTMRDVLRKLFRPPTIAQKKADVDYLRSGGELIVNARLNLCHGRRSLRGRTPAPRPTNPVPSVQPGGTFRVKRLHPGS